MAHTKAKGSSKLGRDSRSQRLGVKKFSGEKVDAGKIIIRQRGTKWLPGEGVKQGKDDTIYAVKAGAVKFESKKVRKFYGKFERKTIVSVK